MYGPPFYRLKPPSLLSFDPFVGSSCARSALQYWHQLYDQLLVNVMRPLAVVESALNAHIAKLLRPVCIKTTDAGHLGAIAVGKYVMGIHTLCDVMPIDVLW